MPPLGVILAGGAGARIGGAKAIVELAGKPLIQYPCEALQAALGEVVILAKADTELPSLPGATVWIEPETPQHPLLGLMHALDLAEGRAVVVCSPVDLPFVTPEVIRRLAGAGLGAAPVVIAAAAGVVQPLLGCYAPSALALLQAGGLAPVRQAIAAVGARELEVDPRVLFNVNTPDDLLQAAAMLDQMRTANARGR